MNDTELLSEVSYSSRRCEIIVSIKDVYTKKFFDIQCKEFINNSIVKVYPERDEDNKAVKIDYDSYLKKMNDIREYFCDNIPNTTLAQEIRKSGWGKVLQKVGFSLYQDFLKSSPFLDCFKKIMYLHESKTVEFIHFIFEGSHEYIIGFPIEFINRGDKYIFLEHENFFMSKRIASAEYTSENELNSNDSTYISPLSPEDLTKNLPIIFHIVLSYAIDANKIDINTQETKLDSFKKEADMLEETLIQYKESLDYNIEVKRVEGVDATKDGLINYINKLKNNYYHVIHFIGEGSFNPYSGGTILLENISDKTGDKEIVYMHADQLASLIKSKKVKFVYLSCCMGAASEENNENSNTFGIVKALVCLANVPSILGFRWPLDNELSPYFAEKFYDEFFKNTQLPRAVQAARYYIKTEGRKLIERKRERIEKEDHTWASPLLIYQNFFQYDSTKNQL